MKTIEKDLEQLRKIGGVDTVFGIALIVRRLKIGYARAGRLLERAISENVIFIEGDNRYLFNQSEMDVSTTPDQKEGS